MVDLVARGLLAQCGPGRQPERLLLGEGGGDLQQAQALHRCAHLALDAGGVLDAPAEHLESPADAEHRPARSEEHTSELQSLMRISYAVFCLKKKTIP